MTVWWRRWESKTSDSGLNHATTGNHGKSDSELAETKDERKHVGENVLPTGKIEHETMQGRADAGDVPTGKALGTLARKVLASSRHADARRMAYSVMLSQGELSWSKQRFLAVRVGTLAQALYSSSQLSSSSPSGQVPHTSSTPASPPQAATRTSSPITKIRINFNIIPPPHSLMDRKGVVKLG